MEHEHSGAARLHPDGVSASELLSRRPASPTPAVVESAAIASSIVSSVRSVVRAPISISSCARWKSNQPMWPMRGLIVTSGGSPARRARVMRSCMMLKASIITVGMPGRPDVPKNWRLSARSAPNIERSPLLLGELLPVKLVVLVGAVVRDRAAAAEDVGVEVDRDHEARAERARRRHRHRIDQRAVHQPAAAEPDRRENPGQRIGGAHRVDQPSARQPDLVAGADLGGDGGEADRQLLDQRVAEHLLEPRREPAAADQAGAGQADVEIAEDAAPRQLARPLVEAVELAGGVAAADHGADRGADDDVGLDAVGEPASGSRRYGQSRAPPPPPSASPMVGRATAGCGRLGLLLRRRGPVSPAP